MAAKPQASAARPEKAFKPILLAVLLLPAAALMPKTAIVLLAALTPSLAARLVDGSPGRYLTISVLGMNVVGALYFLHALWAQTDSFIAVTIVLSDPIGWLAVLAGAGCGWLLYVSMPAIVARTAEAQSALRMRRVRRDLTQLTEEWGPGVAGEKK